MYVLYFDTGKGAKNEHVLADCSHLKKTHVQTLQKFLYLLHVAVAQSSDENAILMYFWFCDDVAFSHNEAYCRHVMYYLHHLQ